VAAGALIATAGPAVGREYLAAARRPPPTSTTLQADDLFVRLRASPALPGANTVEIQVTNTRRPAPAAIAGVDLDITGADGDTRVTATPDAAGVVLVDAVKLAAGSNKASVTVRRDGMPDGHASFQVEAPAPVYTAPVFVSSRPIRTPLLVAAVVLGVTLLAFLVVPVRGRRRQREARRTTVPEPVR